jgi:hypothetical protein
MALSGTNSQAKIILPAQTSIVLYQDFQAVDSIQSSSYVSWLVAIRVDPVNIAKILGEY